MIINKLNNIHNKLYDLLPRFKKINLEVLNLLPTQISTLTVGENTLPMLFNKTIQEVTEDDLNNVTKIGDSAFKDCTNLTSITIPDSVTSIGYQAFMNCDGLTSITIPDSVTSIGTQAFYWCRNITSITIPDSVTSIGSVTLEGTAYYRDSSNWTNDVLYINNHLIDVKTSIISCDIKQGVKTIATEAFANCTSLINIIIPDSVVAIGDAAFSRCTNLTSVTIPDSVTTIGSYAFLDCTNLTNVTLSKNITYIPYDLFDNCISLTDIYLRSTTPIKLDMTSFIPANVTTIHVPVGSGEAYKSATNWSYYADKIVEDIEL